MLNTFVVNADVSFRNLYACLSQLRRFYPTSEIIVLVSASTHQLVCSKIYDICFKFACTLAPTYTDNFFLGGLKRASGDIVTFLSGDTVPLYPFVDHSVFTLGQTVCGYPLAYSDGSMYHGGTIQIGDRMMDVVDLLSSSRAVAVSDKMISIDKRNVCLESFSHYDNYHDFSIFSGAVLCLEEWSKGHKIWLQGGRIAALSLLPHTPDTYYSFHLAAQRREFAVNYSKLFMKVQRSLQFGKRVRLPLTEHLTFFIKTVDDLNDAFATVYHARLHSHWGRISFILDTSLYDTLDIMSFVADSKFLINAYEFREDVSTAFPIKRVSGYYPFGTATVEKYSRTVDYISSVLGVAQFTCICLDDVDTYPEYEGKFDRSLFMVDPMYDTPQKRLITGEDNFKCTIFVDAIDWPYYAEMGAEFVPTGVASQFVALGLTSSV